MCGIFGLYIKGKNHFSPKKINQALGVLIKNSGERGKDSAGLYASSSTHKDLIKFPGKPADFLRSGLVQNATHHALSAPSEGALFLGHCRLAMSGSSMDKGSIQPIQGSGFVGLHNGYFSAVVGKPVHTSTAPGQISDSHFFFQALSQSESRESFSRRVEEILSKSTGSYNICVFNESSGELVLASNTGSLYVWEDDRFLCFASEPQFVSKALRIFRVDCDPQQIKDKIVQFNLARKSILQKPPVKEKREQLRRCSRCILPHTYPMITFNEKGVCNFCESYQRQGVQGEETLERFLSRYRSSDGSPDCLVGISGGRDSSYGLYVLKEKFGMTPISYTFDWGLTTDTARRNQARITGALGVEHVVRSADLDLRRRHVRSNVEAFLRRPHLGMVPLFMAGDKDFYQYGRKIRRERGIKLTVHCTGHEVERLHFKTGFCGVDDTDQHNVRLYNFSHLNKLKLAFFYISQYALNPYYINASFLYSVRSFWYSFLAKDDFLYLYQYLQWDEKVIEKTLSEKFGWESDPGYGNGQWRMGDGQTAFTNYIYHQVAGFSEFDNFRANQVRAGLISRQEALDLAEEDNQPKWQALQYFASAVGLNLEEALKKVQRIPKLY